MGREGEKIWEGKREQARACEFSFSLAAPPLHPTHPSLFLSSAKENRLAPTKEKRKKLPPLTFDSGTENSSTADAPRRPVTKLRLIQHKAEAFWFYRSCIRAWPPPRVMGTLPRAS